MPYRRLGAFPTNQSIRWSPRSRKVIARDRETWMCVEHRRAGIKIHAGNRTTSLHQCSGSLAGREPSRPLSFSQCTDRGTPAA